MDVDDYSTTPQPPASKPSGSKAATTSTAAASSAKPAATNAASKPGIGGPSSSSTATSASAVAAKKKAAAGGDDDDFGPCMQVSNKTKRMDEEKALKTLKWNFDAPRKEFVEQLRFQMETAQFSRSLLVQLFHDDFKYHTNALQTLHRALDECQDATLSNLDLILRWLSLRFFETNPTVMLKAIEYMQALFGMLATQRAYHLSDYEASAFVPYLIGKFGDPKEPIRRGFRSICKQIGQCYAPVKIFNYLVAALTSKNSRLRADCLEELGQMIEALGLQPFNPAVTLKEIAKQIGDRDTSVRNAALNTITVAYQIAGDQVYKFVGRLNEKDQSMLDERIKRSGKPGGGVKSSASGPINGSMQALNNAGISSVTTLTNSNSYMSFQQQQQPHNGSHLHKYVLSFCSRLSKSNS
jgi:cytoskeleton-associated protein 5